MTRVKICGLTRPADVDVAVAAGADAVGFVVDVSVDTPREVPVETAADLIDRVPPFVSTVVVTMGGAADAAALADRVNADAVQVHGDVDPDAVAALDVAAIAAIDADDPDPTRYVDAADALLVDSADDAGGGGTGRTHDWERTREVARGTATPVVVAGGLTPENVAAAVTTVEPFGVDVATGVEARGGVKDGEAVTEFVDRAKRAASTATP